MRSALCASMAGVAAALCVGHASASRAESWCATPVIAHEWGVQLFSGDGAPRPPATATLPPWFHRQGPAETSRVARVADLPPDSGIRLLPLLHFYAPGGYHDTIPLGLGVGFAHGAASAWFPQVDVQRSADTANSAAARAIHAALVEARAHLKATFPRPTLPDDPTEQLQWGQLTLTTKPSRALGIATAASERWIAEARQLRDALWVARGDESDRFVFYEGVTSEHAAVRIRRGPRWSLTSREYVIENPTAHAVHDVFVIHRVVEGARLVAFAPTIPAGGAATVTLAASSVGALREALRARWVEPGATGARDGKGGCAMMRDPAIPVQISSGHRLYAGEIDLLLTTWAEALFESTGTTIVYREDAAYLDHAMPLSLFTDMYHYVELRRLGVAIWQRAPLP